MHFFPTSSSRISGKSCFVDLLWLFCFWSWPRSPDPDAPVPCPPPLPTEKESRPFFPLLNFVFFFPRQHMIEHRKFDLFFVSERENILPYFNQIWWLVIYNWSKNPSSKKLIIYLFVEHRYPFERWKDVKRHYCLEILVLLRKTGPLNGVHWSVFCLFLGSNVWQPTLVIERVFLPPNFKLKKATSYMYRFVPLMIATVMPIGTRNYGGLLIQYTPSSFPFIHASLD